MFGAGHHKGNRSIPPMRLPLNIDMGQGVQDWNNNVGIIVQIESMEGVNNIEEICAIERIDCIWVLPFAAFGGFTVDVSF